MMTVSISEGMPNLSCKPCPDRLNITLNQLAQLSSSADEASQGRISVVEL